MGRILRAAEHLERGFDVIVRHEQLHAGQPAFHGDTGTYDDRGYVGGVQRDPRQVRFYSTIARICTNRMLFTICPAGVP